MADELEVLFSRRGAVGHIKFNRPKALNALNYDMVLEIQKKLDEWEKDPDVAAVIIQGEGDRAFCAGGDIRRLAETSKKEGLGYCREFFSSEFKLNRTVFRYPKPYIAILDGITMGGGVGLSVHGHYRIATERTLFAMPETGIGYFPDVGGSYFLPRCPGSVGMYLGLSGARLKTGDSLKAGISTHYVETKSVDSLIAGIEDLAPSRDVAAKLDTLLSQYCRELQDETLTINLDTINECFSKSSVEEILTSLDEIDIEWSKQTASSIRKKSPTSLKVTFRQLKEGKCLSFEDCMAMELRLALRFMEDHDFYEGVRAVIIEKDNQPKWMPDSVEGVSEEAVARYFLPLGEDELKLV